MFKDGNRPDGGWGEEYDRQTGVKFRKNVIDRPVVALWNMPEIDELLKKLNEDLQ